VSPEPSSPQAEQPQLSQPVLPAEGFQPSQHGWGPAPTAPALSWAGYESLESHQCLGAVLLSGGAGKSLAGRRGAGRGAAPQPGEVRKGRWGGNLCCLRWGTWVCEPSFWLGRQGMSKTGAEIIRGPVREQHSWSPRLGLVQGGWEPHRSPPAQREGGKGVSSRMGSVRKAQRGQGQWGRGWAAEHGPSLGPVWFGHLSACAEPRGWWERC